MKAYLVAGMCLIVGFAIGYIRLQSPQAISPATIGSPAPESHAARGAMDSRRVPSPHEPSLDEMKQVADKQAAPILEKLKSDPKDQALLVQAGDIYYRSHRFTDATAYYDTAVKADPAKVALRTKLASSLYRSGDVDGAIAELNRALRYDPRDANTLFDLGVIRLQGKGDAKGALAAWQQLLKSNPQLSAERKATVQKLMADVLTTVGNQDRPEGARKP
jgi:cytochrome c-type biogenesis protein CcmH/NrfG